MDRADRSSDTSKKIIIPIKTIKIFILLLLPILIWNIDYHAEGDHFSFCLFRIITGRECYGCGLLRGISALLHGDFREISRLNRLNPFTIPLVTWLYLKEIRTSYKDTPRFQGIKSSWSSNSPLVRAPPLAI